MPRIVLRARLWIVAGLAALSFAGALGWGGRAVAAEAPAAEGAAEDAALCVRIADAASGGHVHPAICVTAGGAVLVAHFAEPEGKIFLLRSTDGGRSWADLGTVPDIGGGLPYPGALTTLADGRALLTWNFWVDPKDFTLGRRPWFATSADEGATWSDARKLPIDDAEEGYVRHSVWERSENEWIFPLGIGAVRYDPDADRAEAFGDLRLRPGPLVRTAAGTLLHGAGHRSTDEGATWTALAGFPGVASYRCDLKALDNGWVLGAVAEDDQSFYLVASYDDGLTWNLDRRWVIYEPGRYIGRACPQLAPLDPRTLGVVFWDAHRDQPGGAGVYFARLDLEELRRRTGGPEPVPAAPAGAEPAAWYEPFPAHRIAGSTYYVGSKDLACYLVATPEGHFLINTGLEETVPLIRASVESLGFAMTDIKVILASHAHSDHCAGHARAQALTGAQVMVMAGDDGVIASGGAGQYLYTDSRWAACPVDRVLTDGEEVTLGGVTLTARHTPGHTRGCTTWTWTVQEEGRELSVVVIGSPNVNPGYRLVDNADYPEIADDYARTFEVLSSLPCDIFLGAHGGYYGMVEKYERFRKHPAANPFIDTVGYEDYVLERRQAFQEELKAQQRRE
jgi:metallo-beta-lactamase class B